jgi:O-antigen/teichoic acid export membrane protein
MSLKNRASKALAWSFVDRIAQYGLQSAVSIILARLLLPGEVGLIGMLSVFLSFGAIFSDVGFGPALLQKNNSTNLDHCSVFFFNIVASSLGATALWFAAPTIAEFYGNSELCSLTRVIAFILPFSALGNLQSTLLNKNLDLKSQAKASVVSGFISGLLAVTMAWFGCGVWSLAAQSLTQALIRSILLWQMSDWRPKMFFSWSALSSMWPFGSRVLSSAFINTVVDSIFPVAIGKYYSPTVLGLYTMANRIPYTFASSLSSIVGRVSLPLYIKIRDQPDSLRKTYMKTMTMICFVNTPLMVGIATVATPLVQGLLTQKWLPAIPYIQLVSVAMIFLPIINSNMDALIGSGRADLHMRFTIISKLLKVSNIVISFKLGVLGFLSGEIVVGILTCIIQAFIIGKIIKYSILRQLIDVIPILFASSVLAISVLACKAIPLQQPLLALLVQTLAGALSFIAFSHFFRITAFLDLLAFAGNLRRQTNYNLV